MARFMDARVAEAMARVSAVVDESIVLRRRDLLAAGVSDSLQSAMYRRGVLTRPRHGVYVLADQINDATPRQLHRIHVAAAIAAAEEPTWAFGQSAASLLGMPLPSEESLRVTLLRLSGQDERSLARPSRHRLVVPGTDVTTHAVTEADLTVTNGVPTVGAALAAVSAARGLSHRWQVALCDAALWDSTATVHDLLRLAEEWRSRGGKAQLDKAIARSRRGAQTVLETFSRLILIDHGLPEPQLQSAFHDRAGLIGYVDMCWPELRVIGEADGSVKYSSRDDLVREKIREDRLRALGFRVVRWMWTDIHERPEHVVARIRGAVRVSA